MTVHVLRLRPGKEKPVLAGHPWIFSGALAELDATLPAGALVDVCAADGRFLGRGYVNPRCAITVRVLTREAVAIDAAFVRSRVDAALQLRRALVAPGTDAFRLLNGEGDFLPGVIADVYGSFVTVQCLTAGARALPVACEHHELTTAIGKALYGGVDAERWQLDALDRKAVRVAEHEHIAFR